MAKYTTTVQLATSQQPGDHICLAGNTTQYINYHTKQPHVQPDQPPGTTNPKHPQQ